MKIFIFILLIAFSHSSFAEYKNIDLGWSNKGLKVDFPKYKHKSRQFKSDYRLAESTPKRVTREGFRNLDKAVNKKLKNLFN